MPRGTLFINGNDAYTTWGLSLAQEGLSALMTPPPMKEIISNSSRLEHGKRYINNNPKKESRDVSLPINITAHSAGEFMSRYASFCEELAKGRLDITTSFTGGTVFKMLYISCTQFSEWSQSIGKFVLKLNEPNPDDRSPSQP